MEKQGEHGPGMAQVYGQQTAGLASEQGGRWLSSHCMSVHGVAAVSLGHGAEAAALKNL